MNSFHRSFLTLSLLLFSGFAFGQAATFKATVSKDTVQQDEHVMVTFDFNLKSGYKMRVSNFSPPRFKGFRLYAGPLQQSSFRFENGRQTRGIQYSYVLIPEHTGTFVIGPAQIQLEGQIMKTKPLKILVKAGSSSGMATSASPHTGYRNAPSQDGDIHFVLALSDDNPYVGQPITGTYILYTRKRNIYSQLNPTDFPKFPGFWNQEIKLGRLDYRQTVWRGQPYYEIILRKVVLIPQKTGELTVDPFQMEVPVMVATGDYDFFGRSITRTERVSVSTGKRLVRVRPLPLKGQPADFSGAVGRFKLRVKLDKSSLKAGESARLNVRVSGVGNLKLFELPKPAVPQDLERYEPKHSAQVATTEAGLTGSVSDDYVLVPRYRGTYHIQPVTFSYFDPSAARYRSLRSQAYTVHVTTGQAKGSGTASALPSNPSQKVELLDKDIRYIEQPTALLPLKTDVFFGSSPYYWLLLLPLVLILLIAFSGKLRSCIGGADPMKSRRKAAQQSLSKARKRLKQGDNRAFYAELERAILGFLSAALHIDKAQLTRESIRAALTARNLDENLITQLIQTLDQSQFERYTSGVSKQRMQEIYERAAETITQLHKALK